MTELKHDPEFPYVVLFGEWVAAKFPAEGMGKVNAINYARESVGTVIDTTPKTKIPDDADYIIWELDGETLMAYRDGGEWFGNGEYWTEEQMAEEVENAEVTVLVRKEDQ